MCGELDFILNYVKSFSILTCGLIFLSTDDVHGTEEQTQPSNQKSISIAGASGLNALQEDLRIRHYDSMVKAREIVASELKRSGESQLGLRQCLERIRRLPFVDGVETAKGAGETTQIWVKTPFLTDS